MLKSILRFTLLLVVLFGAFSALAIYWTFYKPLPEYESSHKLTGLNDPVNIYWDDYGVPHVFASNELDLYMALGYAHAQDRLWQLTLNQMYVEGRFAEFLGEDLIELDRFSRTIGFWRIAGELEKQAESRELQILQAYSNGINQFIEANKNRLPIEFSLVEMNPMPWTPRHSYAMSRALGWELNVSWWSKVMLGFLETELPKEALIELFPEWHTSHNVSFRPQNPDSISDQFTISKVTMSLFNTDIRTRAIMGQKGSHIGSNAWVVDGTRTETGYPLLAGDPHLGLDMPGKWYEVHLNLNGRNISGATIAGVPAIILGQTDRHAWSFTSLMPDDTDFFIESINPLDRSEYLADKTDNISNYKPFEIVREIIKTKGGNEILHEIRITQNGPIISDIHPNSALFTDKLVSMNWTGYALSSEFSALLGMANATTFRDFQSAAYSFGVPALNLVYGDIDGNIALITTGNIPMRNSVPLLFKDGWDSNARWDGFIPINELPTVINPESGYIANANNPVVGSDYPHYITAFWEPDSRIRRIDEVLKSSRLHTPQSFKELQNDVFSHQAKDLTQIIVPVLSASNDTLILKALPYLQNWDFNYTRSATAASLTEAFFLKFVENVFKPHLGETVFNSFTQLENFPIRVTTKLIQEPSIWLRTIDGDFSFRDSLIVESMRLTVQELYRDFGANTTEWRWEKRHTLTLSPPLFSQASKEPDAPNTLKLIVNNVLSKGPYPVGGHSMSVNNTQYDWHDPYGQVLGASIRRIVDLSNLSKSESVIPTGQSGNPLSTHFGDQTELWLSGKYRIFEHNNIVSEQVRLRTMELNP